MTDNLSQVRALLECITKGAPAEKPEFIESDNYGDVRANGAELDHWYYAEIAREALRLLPSPQPPGGDEALFAEQEKQRLESDAVKMGIDLCPSCGSGDVRFCHISVRPYCAECNTWGAVNYGTAEDSIKAWNKRREQS